MAEKFLIGDVVRFVNTSDDIYPYPIPSSNGTVRLVTNNIILLQTLGVEIPMCIVSFPEGSLAVYSEDLQLIDKTSEVRSHIDVN